MEYVIKMGSKYIGCDSSGKYVERNSIQNATRGPMHKLQNVINNCIAPSKRNKCRVVEVNETMVKPVVAHKVQAGVSAKSLVDGLMHKLKAIDVSDFNQEKSTLNQKLSLIDQEITDIQHYIEFNRLNAAKGYQAYKLLQEKLLERRVIKDDLAKFQVLASAKLSDVFDGTLDSNIKALDNKTYTPRVLVELFQEDEK